MSDLKATVAIYPSSCAAGTVVEPREEVVVTVINDVVVEELTKQQGRDLFEAGCVRELGVGADVFLRAYDADEMPAEWSARAVQRVEFLLPFVR